MASKFGHEFNFVVGGRVRCQQADGRTRTAAVAYVNDDGTVDLIYDSSGGADGLAASNVADEEDGVDPARLTVLTGTVAEAQAEAQAVPAAGEGGLRAPSAPKKRLATCSSSRILRPPLASTAKLCPCSAASRLQSAAPCSYEKRGQRSLHSTLYPLWCQSLTAPRRR